MTIAGSGIHRSRPRSSGGARRALSARRWPTRLLNHAVMILTVLLLAAPFYFIINASLKDSGGLFQFPPRWIPLPPYTGNYERLLFDSGFVRWTINTLIVAGSVTVIKIFLDSMAGYALATMEFTGKRVVFALMLILLMVPIGVLIVPLWAISYRFGLLDTYWALILPPLANPLGVFLMRQFILALPKDLENAARLDGTSEFGIYWRIVLPLLKPGLVVLAIITFTDQFLSFIWPLVATQSSDMQTLTVGVASLRSRAGINYGLWSAASVMSMVPMAIFFFALQRQFHARSLAGALK